MAGYTFDASRLVPWEGIDLSSTSRLFVVVLCGSFNPIHHAHLETFEAARQCLETESIGPGGLGRVVGGFVSPVSDHYRKPWLLAAAQRVEICRASVSGHPLLAVDTWESAQPEYQRTYRVLRHIFDEVVGFYARTATTPEQKAVVMRSLADGPRPSALVLTDSRKDLHPRFHVAFALGADLFESFLVPGVWQLSLLKRIFDEFDLVVASRRGYAEPNALLARHTDPIRDVDPDLPLSRDRPAPPSAGTVVFYPSQYTVRVVTLNQNALSSTFIRDRLAEDANADLDPYVPREAHALVRQWYGRRTSA